MASQQHHKPGSNASRQVRSKQIRKLADLDVCTALQTGRKLVRHPSLSRHRHRIIADGPSGLRSPSWPPSMSSQEEAWGRAEHLDLERRLEEVE